MSGLAKWGETSRLTLLLPHGYEGAGPEHSSAREERFLTLAAEGNIRVANVSTPAQYFHLLRRQALVEKGRPLIVFTPKSLLRNAALVLDRCASSPTGALQRVIDDPTAEGRRDKVTRLLLCSGPDLLRPHRARAATRATSRSRSRGSSSSTPSRASRSSS